MRRYVATQHGDVVPRGSDAARVLPWGARVRSSTGMNSAGRPPPSPYSPLKRSTECPQDRTRDARIGYLVDVVGDIRSQRPQLLAEHGPVERARAVQGR